MKKEFMTVGELAKLMDVTVRTLQYYDKEGLLKPACISEGGHRLYSAKEVVKLHQILSFKYLGFSLEEIKNKLFSLDSPQEVSILLKQQKKAIKGQIMDLQDAVRAIDALYSEVLSIQKVDFEKYAEIVELLKMGNKEYWVWKCFNESLSNHIKDRFTNDLHGGIRILDAYKTLLDETLILKQQGESPESERSIQLAEKWWNMILEFTGGDMSLLSELDAFNNEKDNWNNEFSEKQKEIDDFLEAALNSYSKTNISNTEKE